MSKYDRLWQYIGALEGDKAVLSYADIEKYGGVPIDHSFLSFKKELTAYGWQVGRISMKNETVSFERIKE